MKTVLLLLLLWTPRILCIILSLLAMLVAGSAGLIVLLIGIIILAVSWKWPWIGGFLSIVSAIAYILGELRSQDMPDPKIYISLLLLAVLFLLGWFLRKEIRNAQDVYWERTL